LSEWPTYPANLCLILRDVEFAGKREDFGRPIGKAVEIASHRTVGQSAAEHFHDMLRGAKRVKDAVEIGAGREGVSFGRWRKVPGARAGHYPRLANHIAIPESTFGDARGAALPDLSLELTLHIGRNTL